jgi:hypothetical protein
LIAAHIVSSDKGACRLIVTQLLQPFGFNMLWWRFGYSDKNSCRRSEEFSSLQKAAWVAKMPVSATFSLREDVLT